MSETTENIPPVEEGKKSQGSKRTIIIILLLLLLGSIGYNFVNQQKNKATENLLVEEKAALMKDLQELKKNYIFSCFEFNKVESLKLRVEGLKLRLEGFGW